MSGPIVRSAPNKKFTQNWDSVFGSKKSSSKTAAKKKPAQKKTKKKKA
jgi:hypothetical protein